MEITFNSQSLRALINSHGDLVKKYGAPQAQHIARRVAELAAAPSLYTFRHPFPGKCSELDGKNKGKLAIGVGQSLKIFFEACGIGLIRSSIGKLEWKSVKAIRLLEIGETND